MPKIRRSFRVRRAFALVLLVLGSIRPGVFFLGHPSEHHVLLWNTWLLLTTPVGEC